MLQGWIMKLTELTNICYISDMVAIIIKVNIKKTPHGNRWFPANVYVMNGPQPENNRTITRQI